MSTFYAICLDIVPAEDFEDEAVEVEARSEEDAAEQVVVFDDLDDGRSSDVMVADNPKGENATRYKVTQRVRVTYEVRERKK